MKKRIKLFCLICCLMVITQGCQKQTEAMSILKEDTKPQEEKSEMLWSI